jgi:citrate lyase beta subunit
MKYFSHLSEDHLHKIFYIQPEPVDAQSPIELLKYSLGGTLYMPATTIDFHSIIKNKKINSLGSIVICLEDAIKDDEVELAQRLLITRLKELKEAIKQEQVKKEELPFLFIRIRNANHFDQLYPSLFEFDELILGFVFPKFDQYSSKDYIKSFLACKDDMQYPKYFMPILESDEIIFAERRSNALKQIKEELDIVKEYVLNIRIGATDFCSNFGIRRSKDFTIYQIHTVRDCITDILNVFTRKSDEYVVSGCVWEYFDVNNRYLKPQLRVTPFIERFGNRGQIRRNTMITNNYDALIREIIEDKENGIMGKTVIHPSHLAIVNAISVVSHEEYMDAVSILKEDLSGGVIKSLYSNKMNEIKPHTYWAKKIIQKSKVFGVYHTGCDYLSLLVEKGEIINEK